MIASPYLTVNEVAEFCRVTDRTVKNWLKLGVVPSRLIGGRRLIPRDAVAPGPAVVQVDADDRDVRIVWPDGRQTNTTASRIEHALAAVQIV